MQLHCIFSQDLCNRGFVMHLIAENSDANTPWCICIELLVPDSFSTNFGGWTSPSYDLSNSRLVISSSKSS
jgi:hypothetical protein